MTAMLKSFNRHSLSIEERQKRQRAVDYARGSVRLEGFTLSPEVEKINRRFVNGELSPAELVTAIKRAVAHG